MTVYQRKISSKKVEIRLIEGFTQGKNLAPKKQNKTKDFFSMLKHEDNEKTQNNSYREPGLPSPLQINYEKSNLFNLVNIISHNC